MQGRFKEISGQDLLAIQTTLLLIKKKTRCRCVLLYHILLNKYDNKSLGHLIEFRAGYNHRTSLVVH